MSCGYISNLELVNTFICTPNFSQHLEVHSDMKFSHLLNAKFYSKYRIDILFIIQTCLKSQKISGDTIHCYIAELFILFLYYHKVHS
jgi:hypothetical protein